MDFKTVQQQIKLSKKAIEETKVQNRIFENLLQEAIKGAPEEDKNQVQKIQVFANKVLSLAKEGKQEEAQSLIKDFKYGG